MKTWMAFLLLTLLSATTWAKVPAYVEENLYFDFQKSILEGGQKQKRGFTQFDQSLYVDALWDLVEENSPQALTALDQTNTFNYDLTQKLRIAILRLKYNRALDIPQELNDELVAHLQQPISEKSVIYLLAAYEEEILKAGHADIIELAKTHSEYFDVATDADAKEDMTQDMLADLFYRSPDVSTYMNGEYVKSVKIFMFCRSNRIYPCLMVMRNVHGEELRNEDGTLWTHASLASAKSGLPSYLRNGNTPAGIFTIDSVMPAADQQISFGKFRRLILNFVPKSKNEVLFKSLLPKTSHDDAWWKTSTVARDAGRNLFRIHGTGKSNTEPATPYFPFMRTSGCIAQRENTYDGVTYKDQRELLDTIMKAMDLEPIYANEPKIKGMIYVVDMDDTDAPVTLEDLNRVGIE